MIHMTNDKETTQMNAMRLRTVKELFQENVGNPQSLSKLIDEYLIPQALEKKTNAEVSTPSELRQQMLDVIPPE
jgi:hypothetical protein